METYLEPFTSEIFYSSGCKLSTHDSVESYIRNLYSQSKLKETGNFYGTGLTTYFYDDFTSHLDTLPEFDELKKLILLKSKEYIINRVLKIEKLTGQILYPAIIMKLNTVGLKIEKLWFNVNPKGGYQGRHHHANNLLGGTYYVTVPQDSGKIGFTNPNGFAYYKNQSNIIDHLLMTDFSIYPNSGDLLIWPGWMDHEIGVNIVNEPRITLSWGVNWGDNV